MAVVDINNPANYKSCRKKTYEIKCCVPPIGTVVINKLEQAQVVAQLKGKDYFTLEELKSNQNVYNTVAQLAQQNLVYVTKQGNEVVLRGTQGEMWVVSLAKLARSYLWVKGDEAVQITDNTLKELTKDYGGKGFNWITLRSVPDASKAFACFVPKAQQLQVATSWGTVLMGNLSVGEAKHGKGDFVIAGVNPDGSVNVSDRYIVNGLVFRDTYDNRGWTDCLDMNGVGLQAGELPPLVSKNNSNKGMQLIMALNKATDLGLSKPIIKCSPMIELRYLYEKLVKSDEFKSKAFSRNVLADFLHRQGADKIPYYANRGVSLNITAPQGSPEYKLQAQPYSIADLLSFAYTLRTSSSNTVDTAECYSCMAWVIRFIYDAAFSRFVYNYANLKSDNGNGFKIADSIYTVFECNMFYYYDLSKMDISAYLRDDSSAKDYNGQAIHDAFKTVELLKHSNPSFPSNFAHVFAFKLNGDASKPYVCLTAASMGMQFKFSVTLVIAEGNKFCIVPCEYVDTISSSAVGQGVLFKEQLSSEEWKPFTESTMNGSGFGLLTGQALAAVCKAKQRNEWIPFDKFKSEKFGFYRDLNTLIKLTYDKLASSEKFARYMTTLSDIKYAIVGPLLRRWLYTYFQPYLKAASQSEDGSEPANNKSKHFGDRVNETIVTTGKNTWRLHLVIGAESKASTTAKEATLFFKFDGDSTINARMQLNGETLDKSYKLDPSKPIYLFALQIYVSVLRKFKIHPARYFLTNKQSWREILLYLNNRAVSEKAPFSNVNLQGIKPSADKSKLQFKISYRDNLNQQDKSRVFIATFNFENFDFSKDRGTSYKALENVVVCKPQSSILIVMSVLSSILMQYSLHRI